MLLYKFAHSLMRIPLTALTKSIYRIIKQSLVCSLQNKLSVSKTSAINLLWK